MIVGVSVIVPMIVAALVNGNETVGVIHAVSDDATYAYADMADQLRRAAQSVPQNIAEVSAGRAVSTRLIDS